MKLATLTTLLLGTAATLTHAIPAPVAGPEGMIDLVSWGASVVGKELAGVAGEGAGTMGGWRWEDCGESPRASLSKEKTLNSQNSGLTTDAVYVDPLYTWPTPGNANAHGMHLAKSRKSTLTPIHPRRARTLPSTSKPTFSRPSRWVRLPPSPSSNNL